MNRISAGEGEYLYLTDSEWMIRDEMVAHYQRKRELAKKTNPEGIKAGDQVTRRSGRGVGVVVKVAYNGVDRMNARVEWQGVSNLGGGDHGKLACKSLKKL